MEENVQIESGDIVTNDDIRIEFPNLGKKKAEQCPLRFHFVNLIRNILELFTEHKKDVMSSVYDKHKQIT